MSISSSYEGPSIGKLMLAKDDGLNASFFDSPEIVSAWVEFSGVHVSQDGVLRMLRDNNHKLPSDLSPAACSLVIEKLGNTYGSAVLAGTQNDQVRFDAALSHKYKSVRLAALWNPLASFELLLDNMSDVVLLGGGFVRSRSDFFDWLELPENHVRVEAVLAKIVFKDLSKSWQDGFYFRRDFVKFWRKANVSKLPDVAVPQAEFNVVQEFVSKGHIKKAAAFLKENTVTVSQLFSLTDLLFSRHPARVNAFLDACTASRVVADDVLLQTYAHAFVLGVDDVSDMSSKMITMLLRGLDSDALLLFLDDKDIDHALGFLRTVAQREDMLDVFFCFVDRDQNIKSTVFSDRVSVWLQAGLVASIWLPLDRIVGFDESFDLYPVEFSAAIDRAVALFEKLEVLKVVPDYDSVESIAKAIIADAPSFSRFAGTDKLLRFIVDRTEVAHYVFCDLSPAQALDSLLYSRAGRSRFPVTALPSSLQLAAHVDVVEIIKQFRIHMFVPGSSDIQVVAEQYAVVADAVTLLLFQGRFSEVEGLLNDGVLRWDDFLVDDSKPMFRCFSDPNGRLVINELPFVVKFEMLRILDTFCDVSFAYDNQLVFSDMLVDSIIEDEEFSSLEALTLLNLFNVNMADLSHYRLSKFVKVTGVAFETLSLENIAMVEMLSPSWQGTVGELFVLVTDSLQDS